MTGANGFLGTALLRRMLDEKYCVTAVTRSGSHVGIGDRAPVVRYSALLDHGVGHFEGHACVVHAAARVHVMDERASDPLSEFRKVNVAETLAIAARAASSGVKRFIFISSIKVNGEETMVDKPFTAFDKPEPLDPYGISKLEAEKGLKALAAETGMEVVIIRPVLVYGPGVKANFRSMMNWMNKGFPLPFGAICNKRSMVALDNVVDLIVICIHHPAAANQTFLVSDGEDLSTTELLTRTARALDKPARLISVPSSVLEATARVLGKRDLAKRLCGSLQVDIEHTRNTLGWQPPLSVDVALRKAANDFLARS